MRIVRTVRLLLSSAIVSLSVCLLIAGIQMTDLIGMKAASTFFVAALSLWKGIGVGIVPLVVVGAVLWAAPGWLLGFSALPGGGG